MEGIRRGNAEERERESVERGVWVEGECGGERKGECGRERTGECGREWKGEEGNVEGRVEGRGRDCGRERRGECGWERKGESGRGSVEGRGRESVGGRGRVNRRERKWECGWESVEWRGRGVWKEEEGGVWKGEEMEAGSGEEKGGAEEVAAWRQIRGVDGGRDVNGNEGGTCRGWGVGEREGGGGRGVGQQLEAWRGSTEMCGTCCSRYVDNVLM